MTIHSKVPPERLRELLDYNPETGDLTWKERPPEMFSAWESGHKRMTAAEMCQSWNTRFAGKNAGSVPMSGGYSAVSLSKHRVLAHRVAWAVHYGYWPAGLIDHINQQKRDNRISNLREVTKSGNARNMKLPTSNKSGVIGVGWDGSKRRWRAYIGVGNQRTVTLGWFDSIAEAAIARRAAERVLGFSPLHGSPDDLRSVRKVAHPT